MPTKTALVCRMLLSFLVGLSLPASGASGLFDKTLPAANAFFLDLTGTTSGDTVDSRATCYAIQGLVNRGSDTEQLNNSGKPYTVLTLVGGTSFRGVKTLFNKYQASVQRMFLYDPAKDWTFYLAVMAGAQSNGIPVTETVRAALQAQVPAWAGTVVDYTNIGADRIEGYDWALTNLMPNCTKQSVYFARAFDLECMDYVVSSKSFVFNLTVSDAAQSNQCRKIFSTPGYGVGASLGGYAGDSVNRLANPYGIGYNVSDFYSNGSFWTSFPNKTYTQRAGQAVPAQNGKVYVAFLLSDGDNLQFDQGDIYSIWKNDPARGTVPVGTSLAPILQEINTPLLDWYYTNKTANDELIAGPCGVQFIYLDDYNPALLPAWCAINAKWFADGGFHTASVWHGTYPSANYDVYTSMSGVDSIRHNANLFSLSSNPQFTNGVMIFNERIRDCQNEQELYDDLAGVATNASAPRFATGKLITPRFGGTNFSAVKVVIDRLNADFPGKYVFQLPSDQAETARDYFQPNRTWNTGNGTWDTSTANWLNSASNAATFANNVNAVVFGDAGGVTNNPVITLNATVTPRHVEVKSTSHNYTLSGAGGIGGNTALILDPANTTTLTLSNPNSYTGKTIVNGGTLTVGAGGRLGSGGNYAGGIYVAGAAALNYQNTSSQTLSGAITGAGTLRQNGGSDLILTGSAGNTINNLFITGGRVFIGNAKAITASTTTTITNNGILDLSAAPTTIGPITVQNNGGIATRVAAGTTLASVTLPGPGTAIFNNDDSRTYPLTISSGQTLAGNLTVQIGGSRTTANGVGGVTLSGILSGSGGLTVRANTNTLTLSGANPYFGDTAITNGTLALSGSGSIANTPNLIVGSGATLDVSAPTTALTLGSGQTLKASATSATTTGTIKVASGKNLTLGNATVGLEFTAFGGGVTAPLTLAGTAGNLDLNSKPIKVTTTSVLSGGPYKLIAKSAAGATVTGTPGALIVAGSGLGSSGTLSVSGGELFLTLSVAANYNITNVTTDVNGTCTPTGVTTVGGGGSQTYTITPNAEYTVATLTVDGVAVTPTLSYTFSNVSTNHTIAATFAPATTLYWDSDSTTAGFGSTPGTWGTDSFWSIDASGSSGTPLSTTTINSAVNFGTATLNYNHPAVTVAADGVNVGNIAFGAGQTTAVTIAGGTITLRDTATITVNNTSATIGSVLTGAGISLTKAGTGILTLTAANDYTGATTISTGTLQLGANNVLPDGAGKGNVAVTGTLDLNTFSATINGLSGAGTVDTVAGGTPILTVGGNDATSTFSGVITDTAGTLALTKIGSGTL
ncbi:MAG: autotransporter-associated beta strand repeat-containing protein, partial [Verrucomicrobia bacterium]|nr:autotransporter-associated beta strand repeat-containing protein [Verrucomicrobiota bacterium]